MAAAIEDNFGLTPKLIEGHGGIFEVIVRDRLVYTNKKTGGRFPDNDTIFQEIRKYKAPLPKTEVKAPTPRSETTAPSCKWPP